MDLNGVRSLFTVLVCASFAIVLWVVFSKRNKSSYSDAAQSIIDDPDTPVSGSLPSSKHENGA